jgi:hypothetical protein
MNELRDLWRVAWQETDNLNGAKQAVEGIWAMPFEASAGMVARDMAACLGKSAAPRTDALYPMFREAVIYRMECGRPVEVTRARVTRDRAKGGRWMTEDGFFVEPDTSHGGWFLETGKDWT